MGNYGSRSYERLGDDPDWYSPGTSPGVINGPDAGPDAGPDGPGAPEPGPIHVLEPRPTEATSLLPRGARTAEQAERAVGRAVRAAERAEREQGLGRGTKRARPGRAASCFRCHVDKINHPAAVYKHDAYGRGWRQTVRAGCRQKWVPVHD